MHEVTFPVVDPRMLAKVVPADASMRSSTPANASASCSPGASVLCVNSTASGGGVAEMLRVLLPYVRGVGIDARWLVIEGDDRFFEITKRLHNHLYGAAGRRRAARRGRAPRLRGHAARQRRRARQRGAPGDIVIVHDPQTGRPRAR